MSVRAKIIFRNAAIDLRKKCSKAVRNCVKRMRSHGITPLQKGNDFQPAIELLEVMMENEMERVFREYRNKQSNYEPLFSMPPARRAKAVKFAKPLTLVERRAAAAKRKVVEWQRKSKLATTKIKQYRKKVSYYTKKGVIK